MRRSFAILDVFTDRALTGNPLAVVFDADGLADERMQAVAAEFNLSETVFVAAPKNPMHTAAIRIFTPRRELPFAGHPTVGAAVILAYRHDPRPLAEAEERDAMLVLEEGVGAIRCGVVLREDRGRAVFAVPQLPTESPAAVQAEAFAGALGLAQSEIGFENHTPTVFSSGVPFAFVPVRNLEAIRQAAPQLSLWSAAFEGVTGAFVYTRETFGVGRQFHARMFAPGAGIMEDPATGAAVAAFAGVAHRFDAMPSGWHNLTIEQGFEMKRPSLITLEVEIEANRLAQARIAGDAVVVATGELTID